MEHHIPGKEALWCWFLLDIVFMVAFFMVFMAFMETLLGAMAGLGREESTYWWSRRQAWGFSMASKQ